MNHNVVILPGSGTPRTMTVKEDSVIEFLSNGRMLSVKLRANVPTRIEFLNNLTLAA